MALVVSRFNVCLVSLDPTRTPLTFQRKKGQIVLDQIRTVDKARLVKRLGKLDTNTAVKTLVVLQEIFAE